LLDNCLIVLYFILTVNLHTFVSLCLLSCNIDNVLDFILLHLHILGSLLVVAFYNVCFVSCLLYTYYRTMLSLSCHSHNVFNDIGLSISLFKESILLYF